MRSSAEDRSANSIRCRAWTATGDRSEGDATSTRVSSAGTSRAMCTHASTRNSESGCAHAMVRRL